MLKDLPYKIIRINWKTKVIKAAWFGGRIDKQINGTEKFKHTESRCTQKI